MPTVRNLTIEVGAKTIVDGVDPQVRAGEELPSSDERHAQPRPRGTPSSPGPGLGQPMTTGFLSQPFAQIARPDYVTALGLVLGSTASRVSRMSLRGRARVDAGTLDRRHQPLPRDRPHA